MQTTANYGLKKPEGTDVVDIQNFNDNADIIDAELKERVATSDYTRQAAYAVDTGTANTYVVTLNPAPTALIEGMCIAVKIKTTSTGASTLNVNGLGAKAILDSLGNAITSGGLKAGIPYTFRYNGTNFIVQGKGGGGNATAPDLLSGKTANVDSGPITGSMPNNGAVTITPGTTDQAISLGYHNGQGKVVGDANLQSPYILKGKSIFGVIGSLTIGSLGGKKYASSTISNPSNTTNEITIDVGFTIGVIIANHPGYTKAYGIKYVRTSGGGSDEGYLDIKFNSDDTVTLWQTNGYKLTGTVNYTVWEL